MFDVGDVVKLKSGGPAMTVEFVADIDKSDKVTCVWFEQSFSEHGVTVWGATERAVFEQDVLVPVTSTKSE